MNKNIAVTLAGSIVAVITLIAGFLPEGPWRSGANDVAKALSDGPLHDLLLLGGGYLAAAGFSRLFKTDNSAGEAVTKNASTLSPAQAEAVSVTPPPAPPSSND